MTGSRPEQGAATLRLTEEEWEARMAAISDEAVRVAEEVWSDEEPSLAEYELAERILAWLHGRCKELDDLRQERDEADVQAEQWFERAKGAARLEAERDEAREEAEQESVSRVNLANRVTRAESAFNAFREAVEAQADRWASWPNDHAANGPQDYARALRATIADALVVVRSRLEPSQRQTSYWSDTVTVDARPASSEATERVEWGVRCSEGIYAAGLEFDARLDLASDKHHDTCVGPRSLVRRARTITPDRVTEWEEVDE